MTPERALKSIGIAQSFESGLRCSVAVIFRLILGYMAGLPPTAISFNGALSLGLSLLFEVPAGLLGDVYGTVRCCVLGYLAQAIATACLFTAVAFAHVDPIWMWIGITAEAVFDAMGNALLSGAREVTYRSAITQASASLGAADRLGLERQFLVLSERYGRAFLVVIPGVLLSAAVWLYQDGGHESWTLLPLAAGWLYLAWNIHKLSQAFGIRHQREGLSMIEAGRASLRAVAQFGRVQWGAALPFITLTFVFGVVHGFLIVSILRQGSTWIDGMGGHLWVPIVAVNMMFIFGRLLRSAVLPRLAKRHSASTLAMAGGLIIAALGCGLVTLPVILSPLALAGFLLIFPLPFDNAHGAVTRPALGVLMQTLDPKLTVSIISILSAASSLLATAFAIWLTLTGEGVPDVNIIGMITAGGGLFAAATAWMMREVTHG